MSGKIAHTAVSALALTAADFLIETVGACDLQCTGVDDGCAGVFGLADFGHPLRELAAGQHVREDYVADVVEERFVDTVAAASRA